MKSKIVNVVVVLILCSGETFVSGFIYALLNVKDLKYAVDCGAARGVLAMTTAAIAEIEHLTRGESSAAKR